MTLETRETLAMLLEEYGFLLTQTQKQCLHLRVNEDLSLKEISEIMATTRQAVNDAIKKGEKKLLKIKKGINE